MIYKRIEHIGTFNPPKGFLFGRVNMRMLIHLVLGEVDVEHAVCGVGLHGPSITGQIDVYSVNGKINPPSFCSSCRRELEWKPTMEGP